MQRPRGDICATRTAREQAEGPLSGTYVTPGAHLAAGIGIALIGLLVVCCIAYLYLFYSTSNSVDKALDTIIASQEAASPTDEPSQDIDN